MLKAGITCSKDKIVESKTFDEKTPYTKAVLRSWGMTDGRDSFYEPNLYNSFWVGTSSSNCKYGRYGANHATDKKGNIMLKNLGVYDQYGQPVTPATLTPSIKAWRCNSKKIDARRA
jgi:hypothetical protein